MQFKNLLVKLLDTILPDNYTGIEIGVDKGETTFCLLTHCHKLEFLHAVDPFIGRDDWFKELSSKLSYYDKCCLYRDKSENVAHFLPQLDFVFIDGDHSYEGVKIDLEKYVPKIKSGGILAGHDWTCIREDFGVVQAGTEYLEANQDLFKPLMVNEQLAEIGLGEFRQAAYSPRLDRSLLYKKHPSQYPLWWVQIK
jgi:hypothetical protein